MQLQFGFSLFAHSFFGKRCPEVYFDNFWTGRSGEVEQSIGDVTVADDSFFIDPVKPADPFASAAAVRGAAVALGEN